MQNTKSRRSLIITRLIRFGWLGLLVLLVSACHYDMYDQPKYRAQEPSTFFADGRSIRQPVADAVQAGAVLEDEYFLTGLVDGVESDVLPVPISKELLLRGQEQFDIHCAACHGRLGNGQSIVSERGAIVPASLHDERLVDVPISHFYTVTTNGFRNMYGYASRINPEDRWAIAAYIRALQLSQNASIDDVPADVSLEDPQESQQ